MALCCVRSASMKESITRPRTEQRERERESRALVVSSLHSREKWEKNGNCVWWWEDDDDSRRFPEPIKTSHLLDSAYLTTLVCAALPFNTFSTDDELQLCFECASAFSRLLRLNCRQAAPDYSCPLSQFLAIWDNFLLSLIAISVFFSVDQLQRRAQACCVVEQLHGFNFAYQRSAVARERMAKPERCVKF